VFFPVTVFAYRPYFGISLVWNGFIRALIAVFLILFPKSKEKKKMSKKSPAADPL